MKLILNMLTVTSMIQLGKVYKNWMVDLQPKSKKLQARALGLIQQLGKVSPEKAEAVLRQSRKKTKAAILMARQGCDFTTAAKQLKETRGFLHPLLSE